MITNNVDFYNYMRNKGIWVTLMFTPSKDWNTDELVVAFPNTHNSTVCGNRFNNEKVNEYKKECDEIIEWLQCSSRVIVVTPVIKFDSEYMKEHAPEQYERLQEVDYRKQVIHTKDIGELINPHRIQIRYKGVKHIDFDIVSTKSIIDPKYHWISDNGDLKCQQTHYLNVINATRDTMTRRKLRYVPEFTLYSQIYKKLFTK